MQVSSLVASATGVPPSALLVDRDADTRRMYAEYLKLAGCNVEEAEDGREALAKAIARHPDVVITETRLPGIDGYDLCRLLHSDDTTRTIPILFVTADAFLKDVARARAAGADAVLVKPCLPEQLLLEVQRLLTVAEGLRERVLATSETARARVERATALVEDLRRHTARRPLSRAILRFQTTEPPTAPPALVCPNCDQPLRYDHSNVGGVSVRHSEQWDYYECAEGCGTFQYRQRTRKLRRIP